MAERIRAARARTPLEDYVEGLEENNSGGNAYGGHGGCSGGSDVYNGI